WTMQTTIAPSQPKSCAEWRENRQNKLRRGVTAQPEPFPHGLQDIRTDRGAVLPDVFRDVSLSAFASPGRTRTKRAARVRVSIAVIENEVV
ncbi:MAG: hypothetical protein WA231_11360, partial [Methylocella sp.]